MFAAHLVTSMTMVWWMVASASDSPHPLSDEFIDLINAQQTTWRAGRNFHPDTPMEYFNNLMGLTKNSKIHHSIHEVNLAGNIPETFDARENWPNCPSLKEIRDQADCGSCWAFGAVAAMTDRICIHSSGTKQFHVSAIDAISCGTIDGCHGDFIDTAWVYWQSDGIVSGGNFGSHEGCQPYPISPCEHYKVGSRRNCSRIYQDAPDCKITCEKNYNVSYTDDKVKGSVDYFESESVMMEEIFKNGPIECRINVNEDFLSYKSGVYVHTNGDLVGGHAVKVLGWGVENDVKYWLCANSWNEDWGERGFFRILRGVNHVNIESECVAGIPDL